ncbi:HNH endonuclease, partial [Conchiformibius steedae]|uniref:HNH endonuclease n=1 Tax=Conchiformibius steedae TaxID=153493 RepID=UPI0026F292A4
TIHYLSSLKRLVSKITGNDKGSLGLHPAIYFYNSKGKHNTTMFMGTMMLIGEKLRNNDKGFFIKFTEIRGHLESFLINNKELIIKIFPEKESNQRYKLYQKFLEELINRLQDTTQSISSEEIAKMLGVEKVTLIQGSVKNIDFTDEIKNETFIGQALSNAHKCPICNGYLHMEKSVQYDHIIEKSQGGMGESSNCQLTHPFCNQSYKNQGLHKVTDEGSLG